METLEDERLTKIQFLLCTYLYGMCIVECYDLGKGPDRGIQKVCKYAFRLILNSACIAIPSFRPRSDVKFMEMSRFSITMAPSFL